MLCKNSSGKVFGEVEVWDDKIVVQNYKKPILIIEDSEVIEGIKKKDESYILVLYDSYELCIGEIATLYGKPYFRINRLLNKLGPKTSITHGRRNSSYGQKFSEERLQHQRESLKGRKPSPIYERTPEIKQKISQTLKEKYASGEIHNDPQKFSDAWARGCYSEAKMGRGIQGFMFSIKNQKDIYFRSLLELNYYLLLEDAPEVKDYKTEPFQIKISGKSHYTPDILINEHVLVEIKPRDHLNYTSKTRFESEVKSAQKYCKDNDMSFMVLYDTDIDFDTSRYKTYLRNNPDIIRRFNIRFNKGPDAIKAYW